MKIKAYLYYGKYDWEETPSFTVFGHKLTGPTCFQLVAEQEVEFDYEADWAHLTAAQVEALRQEKTRILGEAEAKATAIERQINELLCLEHQPEAV